MEDVAFHDPLIRNLIEFNHTPEEVVIRHPKGTIFEFVCEKDGEKWPCSMITALAEWRAKRLPENKPPSRKPRPGSSK